MYGREKDQSVASHTTPPHQGPNSQPRHVPRPGIETSSPFALRDNTQLTQPQQSGK